MNKVGGFLFLVVRRYFAVVFIIIIIIIIEEFLSKVGTLEEFFLKVGKALLPLTYTIMISYDLRMCFHFRSLQGLHYFVTLFLTMCQVKSTSHLVGMAILDLFTCQ